MNMERVEELCLNYLRQSKNPLVPLSTLAEYCAREDKGCAIPPRELLRFLREHGEVEVMEGPSPEEAIGPELFDQAGIDMGPRAILNTRVPRPEEMMAMLTAQVQAMLEALRPALEAAEAQGETDRAGALRTALARAETMKTRIAAAVHARRGGGD